MKDINVDTDFVKITHPNFESPVLIIKNTNLRLPRGKGDLIKDFNLTLRRGDRFVLTGASGSGKSTIVRAMRYLWQDGNGEIEISKDDGVFCLAQETHIPSRHMRGILSNPKEDTTYSDDEMEAVLREVGLDKLVMQLPSRQANPDYLASLCAPYAGKILQGWIKKLNRLDDTQRGEFLKGVEQYIVQNADAFYPETILPYMNDQLKESLAKKITEQVKTGLSGIAYGGAPGLFSFPMRTTTLAKKVARYFVQASAMELRANTLNGTALSHELSGGEQQKIGFARLLLHKPDIAILDEPTSKMDPVSTKHMYELVTTRLPDTIVFGIAHDENVIQYHTHHGHLNDKEITVQKIC